jgi:hypothetical protein
VAFQGWFLTGRGGLAWGNATDLGKDGRLTVFIADCPSGLATEGLGQSRICWHDHGFHLPLIQWLFPVAFQSKRIRELLQQMLPVKIRTSVDKDSCVRIQFPNQVPPPVIVIENGTVGWVHREEFDGAGRELCLFDQGLLFEDSRDSQTDKDNHGRGHRCVEQ